MRKLALDDDILLEIEKPARYIGGEVNAVMKNVEDIDVRFAMCSTAERMCGARESTLRGMIWIK